MTYKEFNNLEKQEKLLLIHNNAQEIDNIFPWTGNSRIVRIYNLDDFLIELECDLTTTELTNINAFKSFDYLEKYPHHFDKIKNKIFTELNK